MTAFPFEREIRAAEKRLFALVNEERTKRDLQALEFVERLADAAREHSIRMMTRGFFSHQDPDYGNLSLRLGDAGIRWSRCAENIFHSYGWEEPLRLAVVHWMTSPGHRENILLPDVTRTGVGIARKPGEHWYLTQVFVGGRSG